MKYFTYTAFAQSSMPGTKYLPGQAGAPPAPFPICFSSSYENTNRFVHSAHANGGGTSLRKEVMHSSRVLRKTLFCACRFVFPALHDNVRPNFRLTRPAVALKPIFRSSPLLNQGTISQSSRWSVGSHSLYPPLFALTVAVFVHALSNCD